MKDIDYYILKFEFENEEIKNIISDKIEDIYPQIYSAQIYYIDNSNKTYYFKLKNDYIGNYQYISGDSEINENNLSSIGFKGKLTIFPVYNEYNMTFSTNASEFIYYIQLINKMLNKGIEELKQGKPIIQMTKNPIFPLYYYYKIKNENYANININVKIDNNNISNKDNFYISGYIVDEDKIERKKNMVNIFNYQRVLEEII